VQWDDGDIWRREESLVTSQTAMEMYAPVQLSKAIAGMPAGQRGFVVGFTSDKVEVKFPKKVMQCLVTDLQMYTSSHTPLRQQAWGAAHLPSLQAEVRTGRTDPEDDSRSKSRARVNVLRESPEGQKPALRKVEQIPAAGSRCEVQKSQTVVRKGTAEKSEALTRQKFAPRNVEQIPEARKRELPKSQNVVRKCIAEKSLPSSMGTSDQPPTTGSVASAPSRQKTAASAGAKWYTGVVKWSRGSLAWLACEELQARFPDQDVFLHRNDCRDEAMPRQWDRMVFHLLVADGKPRALDARSEAAHQAAIGTRSMTLEEYRASRCKSGK